MSTEELVEPIDVGEEIDVEEPLPSRRFNFGSKKVKIAALLLVVMTVEAAAVYLLVPQPALSHGNSGTGEDPSQSPDPDQSALNVDTAEVDVGSFSCTNNRASTGSIHITFDLVAIVRADQVAKFDAAVNGTNGAHKHRVRQAIVKVARSSNLDDLNDPNLSTMKRLTRDQINKVLRKSYIIEVVISDFRTMEQ